MSRRRRSITARCRIRMSFGRFAGNMAWRLTSDTCGIEARFVAPRWGLFPFCPADPRAALVPRLPWAGLWQAVGLKRQAIQETNNAMEMMDSMLGLKEARQASPGQSESASAALGQQPAKPSSPNGAGHECCAHCIPQLCYAPLGLYPFYISRPQGGARSSLATGWLVAGRWPEETMLAHEHPLPRLKIRCLASKRPDKPAQGKASLRATPWVNGPRNHQAPTGRDRSGHTRCIPQSCSAPLGLCPFYHFQTQGGARSSLALGWLVAGRWP